MKLNYDIIYNIFLQSDDYITVSNFFVLNKTFLQNYIYHYQKTSYKHKFRIIFNHIFSFLNILEFLIMKECDIAFLISLEPNIYFQKDIRTVYELYKDTIRKGLTTIERDDVNRIAYIILTQGANIIDRMTRVRFNRNKIKITLDKSVPMYRHLRWPNDE